MGWEQDALTLVGTRHQALSRVGSVWYQNTTVPARNQVKQMVDSHLLQSLTTGLVGARDLVLGREQVLDYCPVTFGPDRVWNVGLDLGERLESLGIYNSPLGVWAQPPYNDHGAWTALYEDGLALGTEYGQLLLWPEPGDSTMARISDLGALDQWLVAVDPDFTVLRLQMPDGSWAYRGTEFVSEPGVIVMYTDPRTIWPGAVTGACGVRFQPCPYSYSLQIDGVYGPATWVQDFYRHQQGLEGFRRALAEASGLVVWNDDGAILDRQVRPVGYTYWTGTEERRAWYPHTALAVGQAVERGGIVGGDSLDLTLTGQDLTLTLSAPLFEPDSSYDRRARTWAQANRPITTNFSIVP
jgi:hypothetical protein